MNPKGIKLQASHLVPVDKDYKPIPKENLMNIKVAKVESEEESEEEEEDEDEEDDDEEESEEEESEDEDEDEEDEDEDEEEEDAKPTSRQQVGAGGASKAGALLSSTGPMSHWVGRKVQITLGKGKGHDAYVTGSGNGWVQLQYQHDDKDASFIDGDKIPMECAKRSTFFVFVFCLFFFFSLSLSSPSHGTTKYLTFFPFCSCCTLLLLRSSTFSPSLSPSLPLSLPLSHTLHQATSSSAR